MLNKKEITGYVSADELQIASEHAAADISPDLFKKYVAYARKNIFPVLTPEPIKHIHNFYLGMRTAGASSKKSIPITVRQEEAIVRLSEASARVRLSQEIQIEDVERATRLIQVCLQNIGVDPHTGEIDASLWNSGVSKDQRSAIKSMKEILQSRSAHYPGGHVPVTDLYNTAAL